jgi:hypothetical protein
MTMRCVDVIEELAAPHGPDSAALTEHLTHCPRCATWARRSARLDRLWEATRPEEPAPEAWATVWAQVSQALDTASPLAQSPRLRPSATLGPRPWRRWGVATFAIAQAAVILVAAWLVSRPGPDRPRPGPSARTDLVLKSATSAPKPGGTDPLPPPYRDSVVEMVTATMAGRIEIDYGAPVLIESSPAGLKVVSLSSVADEGSSAIEGKVDGNYVMLGYLEAIAE